MAARDYHDRLLAARFLWACFLVGFWLFVRFASGYEDDFGPFTTILMVVGFVFWPRNKAKRLAARARREEDLNEAVRDEIQRPVNEEYRAWRETFEKRRENRRRN